MLRETMGRLQTTGVLVPEIENIVLQPGPEPDFRQMFETGALLGAKRVIIGSVITDEARGTDAYASLCRSAAEFGLDVALEFYRKWAGCASLAQARRIVAAAREPNAKLLVDSLHLNRSGGSAQDLAATAAVEMASLQLCDAAAAIPQSLDDISFESRFARQLLGEGGLDLVAIYRAFPADLPVGIEIPNQPLEDAIGSRAYLERCSANARGFLAAAAIEHFPEKWTSAR
jgi:sugar phosphate isomerase/epimerase